MMGCSPVSRYKFGWQWSDGSIAYYIRGEGAVGKFHCGRFSAKLGVDTISMSEDCAVPVKSDYLCELDHETWQEEERRSDPGVLLPVLTSSTASFPVPTVLCPEKHFTHTFLVFDPKSACWHRHDDFAKNETWDVYFAPLKSLLAMMACDSGRQHVPYSLVCDHQQQCADGSDESFCVFAPCSQSKPLKCLLSDQVWTVCLDGAGSRWDGERKRERGWEREREREREREGGERERVEREGRWGER